VVLNTITFTLLAGAGFKLTTFVVIGTDYMDSCKSIYHTIATTALNGKTIQDRISHLK
jgi:hypothetical protein